VEADEAHISIQEKEEEQEEGQWQG